MKQIFKNLKDYQDYKDRVNTLESDRNELERANMGQINGYQMAVWAFIIYLILN